MLLVNRHSNNWKINNQFDEKIRRHFFQLRTANDHCQFEVILYLKIESIELRMVCHWPITM